MPPKRKAPEPTDTSAGSKPGANKQSNKKSKSTKEDGVPSLPDSAIKHLDRWAKVSASKNLDINFQTTMQDPAYAYKFQCVCNPFRSRDGEEAGDDDEDEESSAKGGCGSKTCVCGSDAAAHPTHPYTITKAGMARHHHTATMVNFRDPDAWNMYTFNDHSAYGALEVAQNLMLDFDEAYKSNDWREAWTVVEGMSLFMQLGPGTQMSLANDGELIQQTAAEISRMVLAALSLLDTNGKLVNDGEVKNIGWMIKLYQRMAGDFRGHGLLEDARPSKAATFRFNANNMDLYLQAYAKERGITVPAGGVEDVDIKMPKLDTKDPWGWTKSFPKHKREATPAGAFFRAPGSAPFGGDGLDITTWASKDRKAAAFEKGTDPVPASMVKKLKEGLVLALG